MLQAAARPEIDRLLGEAVVRRSNPRCRLEIWVPRPGIVYQRAVGHATLDLAEMMVERVELEAQRWGTIVIFDDFSGLTGYDSPVRPCLTNVMVKCRKEIAACHILVLDRLVAMACSVTALAFGKALKTYRDVAVFDALCSEAIAKARHRVP
jgi:hypothetical protein